jgi:hypothetical protein
VHYAAIAAVLGEDALAIQLMMRATDMLPMHLHWIWQPVFRETWKHPDFPKLLGKSGVLAYWQKHGAPEICRSGADNFFCNGDAQR